MITAVDTSVLLDVFITSAPHHAESREALRAAYRAGGIVVSHIAYAELVPRFGQRPTLDDALRDINAQLSPVSSDMAWEAGLRWMRYRQAGGPRTRILADFPIGAHALHSADVFLTRDRGFYKTYFPDLNQAPAPSGQN